MDVDVVIKKEVNFTPTEEENLPLKLQLKRYCCKVCHKKFQKIVTTRLHVEIIHMKMYQVQEFLRLKTKYERSLLFACHILLLRICIFKYVVFMLDVFGVF